MAMVLALPAETTRDGVDDAIRASGLRLVNLVAAAPGRPRQIAAALPDGSCVVSFVDDTSASLLYAIVDGPASESVCDALARSLGVRDWRSLDAPIRDALFAAAQPWGHK
ncbi:MAG: hypothetical protein HOW73_23615 [Polyangiaceae bacterium]|nr:hypothetical protein [Polyangiaceae bacterium]